MLFSRDSKHAKRGLLLLADNVMLKWEKEFVVPHKCEVLLIGDVLNTPTIA